MYNGFKKLEVLWLIFGKRKKNPWDHRRSDKNSSFSQNFVSWMLKLGNSSNKSRQVFSCWSFSKLPWISRKTTSSPSSSEIKTCSTFRPNISEFPLNSFPSSKDSPGAWKSLQIETKIRKMKTYTYCRILWYSLISIRQNYNFDMLATIWHEIVCWFL